MKTTPLICFFLFASTALFAQTQTRTVGSFESIHVAGHYDVHLTEGSTGTLTLHGAADDLKQIETYVKHGELVIKQKKSSWLTDWSSGKISINLPVETLTQVTLSGSGSIQAKHTIQAEDFNIVLSGSGEIWLPLETNSLKGTLTGSGDIELQGKASLASFQLTGSGDVKASSFESDEAYAKVTGSGDIVLHSNSKLEAKISGSGDILCYGDPKIQQIQTTGSGEVDIRN